MKFFRIINDAKVIVNEYNRENAVEGAGKVVLSTFVIDTESNTMYADVQQYYGDESTEDPVLLDLYRLKYSVGKTEVKNFNNYLTFTRLDMKFLNALMNLTLTGDDAHE